MREREGLMVVRNRNPLNHNFLYSIKHIPITSEDDAKIPSQESLESYKV